MLAVVLFGLLFGMSHARAASVAYDFNGTGFDFAFGSWSGWITTGPPAVPSGGLATESGGAGFLPIPGGPLDLTGAHVTLTAQLIAANAADNLQILLIDPSDNSAVYQFPLSSFNTSAMTNVTLSAPSFTNGPVALSQIRRLQVQGDFSSGDRLNLSIDRILAISPADLQTTKSDSPDPVVAGTNLAYTLTVNNAGPGAAASVSLSDTLPAGTTFASLSVPGGWSCFTPAVGAGGTVSCSIANFVAGANSTFTLVVAVSPSLANGTVLSNTATVSSATTPDSSIGNNSATATTTVSNSADLAITKADGVTTATPGGSVTYTLVATNNGPNAAPGATVADTFPASLTCTWTCVGAGGGTCTAAGSGNINDSVNLPVGASTTYTASCTIGATATGTLSNTATVAAPGGVTDPTPGNNSATDSDTLNDGDGVPSAVEDGAPNSGDGNNDGTPDRNQGNVASLPAARGGAYLTLVVSGGCAQIDSASTTTEATFGDDPGFDYPVGLLGFNLSCASAAITVYYHGQSTPPGEAYRKYGPTTPANPATMAFYALPGVAFGSASGVPTASFPCADGALGDDDTGANPRGRIVDPGGPARAAATIGVSIPTLNPWGLALFGVLLMAAAYHARRRGGPRSV